MIFPGLGRILKPAFQAGLVFLGLGISRQFRAKTRANQARVIREPAVIFTIRRVSSKNDQEFRRRRQSVDAARRRSRGQPKRKRPPPA
jgi:hypothetical protein